MSSFLDLWLVSTACWDSMSRSPGFDWLTACWDSLPKLLHAGIVCMASIWPIACWDSLFAHRTSIFPYLWFGDCMLGWHVYDSCYFVSWSLIGWLWFDAFNPIDVSFDFSIAHWSKLQLQHSTKLSTAFTWYVNKNGVYHYAIKKLLYLKTWREKYVKMYTEFIVQLCMYF